MHETVLDNIMFNNLASHWINTGEKKRTPRYFTYKMMHAKFYSDINYDVIVLCHPSCLVFFFSHSFLPMFCFASDIITIICDVKCIIQYVFRIYVYLHVHALPPFTCVYDMKHENIAQCRRPFIVFTYVKLYICKN